MPNRKITVTLRTRELKSGKKRLYLDIWADGLRTTENLKLYLLPGINREERDENRRAMALAETARAKKLLEAQDQAFGIKRQRAGVNFFGYFEELAVSKRGKDGARSTGGAWLSTLNYLKKYGRRGTTFKHITHQWVKGFRDFLDVQPIKPNTKQLYFAKLRACIRKAEADGIIPPSPELFVPGFRGEEVEKTYLTLEEIKKLAAQECNPEILKRAFLFSCLTGLRKSDIVQLLWEDVAEVDGMTRLTFRQKKTGGQEYMDISPEAVHYMGKREKTGKVFRGFIDDSRHTKQLRRWATSCGINKPITFHSARHSFAVLMISLGADIYTVQKLLGHKIIQTTQIYARLLDKNKRAAVVKIPKILE